MIEKDFEEHTWTRMADYESFDIYDLTSEEENFLHLIGFFYWLNEKGSGYTEVSIDDIEQELKWLRPEERFRIKDLIHIIKDDIKENDNWMIRYNVG